MIESLVVATKNPDKRAEVVAVLVRLGLVAEIVDAEWPDVEETGATFADNARLKAHAVFEASSLPALGDDTGLEVVALDGRPGVHTARFAGPDASYQDNVDHLLAQLEGVSDRRARFRTVMVLYDGTREYVGEGWVDGVITESPRGSDGFGYDPVFEVDGTTFAEMDVDAKNEMSHRARALESLALAVVGTSDGSNPSK